MHTTSLEFSKFLVEKGATVETHFVHFDMDGEWQVVERLPMMPKPKSEGGSNNWYPSYTLDELALVFREIGEKHDCLVCSGDGTYSGLSICTDCRGSGKSQTDYFSRFSSTFAANPTEEGWREAEKITMEAMR